MKRGREEGSHLSQHHCADVLLAMRISDLYIAVMRCKRGFKRSAARCFTMKQKGDGVGGGKKQEEEEVVQEGKELRERRREKEGRRKKKRRSGPRESRGHSRLCKPYRRSARTI